MVRFSPKPARGFRVPLRRPTFCLLAILAAVPFLAARPAFVLAQTLREPTGKIRRPLNFSGAIGAVISSDRFDLVLDRPVRVRLTRPGNHDRDPIVELPVGSTQHVLMSTGAPEGLVSGRRARVLGYWDDGMIRGRAIEFDADPAPDLKPGPGSRRRPLP